MTEKNLKKILTWTKTPIKMYFALLPRELTRSELAHIKLSHSRDMFVLGNRLCRTIYVDEINITGKVPYINGAFRNNQYTKMHTPVKNYTASHVLCTQTYNQYKLSQHEVKEWDFKTSFSDSTHTSKFILPNSMTMINEIIVLG